MDRRRLPQPPPAAVTAGAAELAEAGLEELLERAAGGCSVSFAAVFDRTADRVFGLCRRVTRNDSDAEDVTQEVFLEIWRRAAGFDPGRGTAIGWILMIAHSRAVDRVRTAQATQVRDDTHTHRSIARDTDTVIEAVLRSDDARRVRAAIAGLSDIRQQALTLAYLTDHTNQEASDILQVPLPTFKSRVRDALLAIRPTLT